MPQVESIDCKRIYLPSLEGVRGYAFLAVFLAHYSPFDLPIFHVRHWWTVLPLIVNIAWIAVPVFFVMSGYLIGGILYDTRDREGFFRVFYSRRILRVFPIYYITLLAVASLDSIQGISLNGTFWFHLLYVQNLLPGYIGDTGAPPSNQISHFWSLAVEEQFYLVWPLVVWFFPNRRTLLRATILLISLCFITRLSVSWIHISPARSYVATPTRVDAILLGVLLALIRHEGIYKRLEPLAKYAALAGICVMMILVAKPALEFPFPSLGNAFEISLVNFIAAAIIVAALEEGSFLCRLCSLRWICWLGSLSYGLYVFHLVYRQWFMDSFLYHIAAYMPLSIAYFASASIAFCLTLFLALVSYRFIERPAMNLKKRIQYGAPRNSRLALEAAGAVFSRTDC